MASVTIYHNPKCSKSRETLELLKDNGHEPTVVLYLEQTPTKQEMKEILKALDASPRDIIRTGEREYNELNLGDESLTDDELIAAMVESPILIQRPIVTFGGKARIGRPPVSVLELLSGEGN
jgi:arsenate reductase